MTSITFDPRKMADLFAPEGKPSSSTKERLARVIEQNITESGKLARSICQRSGSRELLLKSAKKMASQEGAMENTLSNLRHVEKLLDRSLDQANNIGRSMEQTSVLQEQLQKLNEGD